MLLKVITVRSGFHDLRMFCLNISDAVIITEKGVDYCCIIYEIRKSEGTHLLENFVRG